MELDPATPAPLPLPDPAPDHGQEPAPASADPPSQAWIRAGFVAGGLFYLLGACLLAALAMMLLRLPESATMPFARSAVWILLSYVLALLALGVGSLAGRRWARDLLAVVSGVICVSGVLAGGLILAQPMPSGLPDVRLFSAGGVALILGVVPGLLWAFYAGRRSGDWSAARHRRPTWTMRHTLPELALLIGFGIGGLYNAVSLGSPAFMQFARLSWSGPLPWPLWTALSAAAALLLAWAWWTRQAWAWRASLLYVLVLFPANSFFVQMPEATEYLRSVGHSDAAVGRLLAEDYTLPDFRWQGLAVLLLAHLALLAWVRWRRPQARSEAPA
ncbi:MAG: hypothetical protein Q8O14_04265 [bacterium]|jgi:GNAT superfamily N-acetyltransferase|nr:hypothetical protein [bacterium]